MTDFVSDWIQTALPAVEWTAGKPILDLKVPPSMSWRKIWVSVENTPELAAAQWFRFVGRLQFSLRNSVVLSVPFAFIRGSAGAVGPLPVGEIYLARSPVAEDEGTPDSISVSHHWQGQVPITRTVPPAFVLVQCDRICLVADSYGHTAAGLGGAALCVESSDQPF